MPRIAPSFSHVLCIRASGYPRVACSRSGCCLFSEDCFRELVHSRYVEMPWEDAWRNPRIARVSPRVLPGISTYLSWASSRLTRGGFAICMGGGGVGVAGVGAGAGKGSVMEPAQEQAVRERERARRRWAQALARRCSPVALPLQWTCAIQYRNYRSNF